MTGYLSDLWMYDVVTGEWTALQASAVADSMGLYVSKGVEGVGRPSARMGATAFLDKSVTYFYLFGGKTAGKIISH